MVQIKRVDLRDPVPSVREMHMTIRRLLYAMVQRVEATSYPPEEPVEEEVLGGPQQLDEECSESLDGCQYSDLPLFFGRQRRSKRGRRATADDHSTDTGLSRNRHSGYETGGEGGGGCVSQDVISTLLPPEPPKRRKRAHWMVVIANDFLTYETNEANIYMCLNESDGLYYPCRVLGISGGGGIEGKGGRIKEEEEEGDKEDCTSVSAAWVRFIGYDTYATVNRARCLRPIPDSYVETLNAQLQLESEGDGGLTSLVRCGRADLAKYWDQRYRLFSRFDAGIDVPDEECWFSITPETVASHISDRIALAFGGSPVYVVDCFSGCGGNSIQLARDPLVRVLSSDIDPRKIAALRHNASLYGVQDQIDCCVSDAYSLLSSLSAHAGVGVEGVRVADVVLLAPPWGGHGYDDACFDVATMIPTGDGFDLLGRALAAAPNAVYLLPRTTHQTQFEEMARRFRRGCVVEDIRVWGKRKMCVAYIGPAFQSKKAQKMPSADTNIVDSVNDV